MTAQFSQRRNQRLECMPLQHPQEVLPPKLEIWVLHIESVNLFALEQADNYSCC